MTLNEVPTYIKAKTPELLVKEMLLVNYKSGRHNKYFDISKSGDYWYAWFYNHIKLDPSELIKKEEPKQVITRSRKKTNAVSKK